MLGSKFIDVTAHTRNMLFQVHSTHRFILGGKILHIGLERHFGVYYYVTLAREMYNDIRFHRAVCLFVKGCTTLLIAQGNLMLPLLVLDEPRVLEYLFKDSLAPIALKLVVVRSCYCTGKVHCLIAYSTVGLDKALDVLLQRETLPALLAIIVLDLLAEQPQVLVKRLQHSLEPLLRMSVKLFSVLLECLIGHVPEFMAHLVKSCLELLFLRLDALIERAVLALEDSYPRKLFLAQCMQGMQFIIALEKGLLKTCMLLPEQNILLFKSRVPAIETHTVERRHYKHRQQK